jgi:hypothetical protein
MQNDDENEVTSLDPDRQAKLEYYRETKSPKHEQQIEGTPSEPKKKKDKEKEKEEKKQEDDRSRREWLSKLVDIDTHPLMMQHNEMSPTPMMRVCIRRQHAAPIDQRANTALRIALPRIGISVIDDTPRELLYISLTGLHLEIEDAVAHQTMDAKIWRFQIDDQRPAKQVAFPIIFAPSPVPPDDLQPFMQLAITKEKNLSSIVTFNYVSLLLQVSAHLLAVVSEIMTVTVGMILINTGNEREDRRAIDLPHVTHCQRCQCIGFQEERTKRSHLQVMNISLCPAFWW